MDERQRVAVAWADFSRRVRWSIGCWLGGFVALVAANAAVAPGKLADAVASGLFVAWGLVNIGTALHVRQFRCPYCESRFLGSFWGAPQRCQHCGVIRGRLPPR